MPQEFTRPVEDSVPKVDDTVAVGEDLSFQRRWWRFERAIWIVFVIILLADVLGLFGRGWLAKAELAPADQSMHVDFERIQRASTPSIMTVAFGPKAVHNGVVQLFVSESLLRKLGNQRISPQPASSVLSPNGVTYTFPATAAPAIVEFAMEPSFPGVQTLALQVPGFAPVQSRVVVVP